MNEQQLAAFALSNGAEVSIDGRVINAGRERFDIGRARLEPAPAAPQAPPEPARPTQAYATEAEVRALLAARDAEWSSQLQQMTMLVSQVAQRPERAGPPPEWDFDVSYGPKGQITNIRALPKIAS